MKIEMLSVNDLIPYDLNSKSHPESQINLIARSIEEFGFKTPILVDENYVIIQGHGRRLASLKLNLDKVPVIVAKDLSKEQVKALRIADNKVSESGWKLSELEKEISELEDYLISGFVGFSLDEIDSILADTSIYDDNNEIEKSIIEEKEIPKMERMLNEHNDYIVFVFRNIIDYSRILSEFDVKEVDGSLSPKIKKIGVGRVIDGKKLLRKLDAEKNNNK